MLMAHDPVAVLLNHSYEVLTGKLQPQKLRK